VNEFESLTKNTFYFALGAVDFAVEKTGKAVQDLTEQTQNFVEEMSERGQGLSEPKVRFRKWNTTTRDRLREQLLVLVNRDEALADRLIASAESQYPGHSEGWYLEKVIHDLERDRGVRG
jgi:hypothetical protein